MTPIDCQRAFQDLIRFEAEAFDGRSGGAAESALRYAQRLLQPLYVSLVVHDRDHGNRRLLSIADGQAVSSAPLPAETRADLVSSAMQGGEAVYFPEPGPEAVRGAALLLRLPAEIRSLAVLPLRTREGVVGTLNVGFTGADGIPPDQQAFLEALAAILAMGLRNAQLFESLESACERLRAECDRQKSALKKSRDGLELEVARRTAEIQRLQERLQAENTYLREELAGAHAYGEIIGESPSLRSVVARIERVAPTDASVLILGESGTGKELIARAIHRRSRRADRPLIRVNCATIPKELYESEFFGHVKGSFTGAISERVGRFEAADGGTLFLDEVGEIPAGLQGKLLRVLQEGEFERVGEGRTRRVDVRIIAATNKNLAQEVKDGRFREDLYYRLNVFPIEIAPLRDRREDIPRLAAHFIEVCSQRLSRPAPRLTQANLMDLKAHDWPGNVRELQNIIERALILSPQGRLRFDLPAVSGASALAARPWREDPAAPPEGILTESEIKALQKRNLLAALIQSGWKIYGGEGAAQRLEMKPTTLIERMRRWGIKRPD